MFLTTAGCEAIQRVSTMPYSRNLEELAFKEISEVIKRNIRPKKRLVITERTKFLETRQHPNESIVQLIHRLKGRARYCKFERLGTGEMTTEDELIMLCLIEGMHDPALKHKLLETLQSVNLTVEICTEFVQQLELIKNKTKTREKVKINGKYFHMQVDTGSDITVIPVNLGQDSEKPRLKKSALQLKQFDGTIIKTLGTFEGTFETKNHFEMIPIIVVACTKDHMDC